MTVTRKGLLKSPVTTEDFGDVFNGIGALMAHFDCS